MMCWIKRWHDQKSVCEMCSSLQFWDIIWPFILICLAWLKLPSYFHLVTVAYG